VLDLAQAGNDGRDRGLGQNPAQGEIGHRHPIGNERLEGLRPVDALSMDRAWFQSMSSAIKAVHPVWYL
jgi:hypothetical protein